MSYRRKQIAAVSLLVALAGAAQAAGRDEVPVLVNGTRLDSDALLLRDVNRTVVPMRSLFESLGAQVEWDASQRAVYAWMPDGVGVRIAMNDRNAETLDMPAEPGPGNWGRVVRTFRIDAPAMMRGSRVYVPLRFASESLKADVRYAAYEPAVHIRTQAVAGSRQEVPAVAERPRPLDPEPAREVPRPHRPSRERGVVGLDVELVLNGSRFSRSDNRMTIDMTVTNPTSRTIVVPFRSGQQFDVEVVQEGHVIWNWAHDRAYTQALSEITMRPGDKQSYAARWNFETNDGRRVPPGRYTVRGILMSDTGERQQAAEETITVVR
jgi:hypothetical protein